MKPLSRHTALLSLAFLTPALALAESPPSFGARAAGPRSDETVWPADARIRLAGDQFDVGGLNATVNGAPARLVPAGDVMGGRSFLLSPAPLDGQAVHIEGDPCPAEAAEWGAACQPLVIDYVAGPPLGQNVTESLPRFAFDVYDYATLAPESCGDAIGATLQYRFEDAPQPLARGLYAVGMLNGERIFESDLNQVPSMHIVPSAQESGGTFCLEFFVENVAGGRGPVTRSCDPCRARVTDELPDDVFGDPGFTRDELVNPEGCLPTDGFAAETPMDPSDSENSVDAPAPDAPSAGSDQAPPPSAADTADSESAADADAEGTDGGCSQRPGPATGLPWVVGLLALRRRRCRA
jgi:hypothetical protein